MTFEKAEPIAKVAARIIVVVAIIIIIILLAFFIDNMEMGKAARVVEQTVPQKIARVTSNALNLRAQPSASSGIVKTLRQGDRLSVTGESRNGWLPVEHSGSNGWVNAKYILVE
jgi:uncharacterized protein YgiM (DUF1202 family)